MTTTLRIDKDLYRKAKASAASEGITVTKFIEEGLELRLGAAEKKAAQEPIKLRTFGTGKSLELSPEDIKRLLQEMDAEHDARVISGNY